MNELDFSYFNKYEIEAPPYELRAFVEVAIDTKVGKSTSALKSIWLNHLQDNMSVVCGINRLLYGKTGFPLEHTVYGNKVSMFFDVDVVLHKYQNNKLHYKKVMLSDIHHAIYYTEMGSEKLDTNYSDTPIFAVQMPVNDDGIIKQFAIIDGNHRVSAAFRSKFDIEIVIIMDNFLPPDIFMNNTSWVLFNLLLGYYSLQLELVDESSYIHCIDEVLDHFIYQQ